MLILCMLIRITGFTQEKLANFLGVSRASVNSWIKDDSSLSDNSKKIIAQKFKFPVSYFDIDLNQDRALYKVVYSTLYESWNNNYDSSSNNRILDILNEIESDLKQVSYKELTDMEIMEGLCNGYNPFTGEVFSQDNILLDRRIKSVLIKAKDNFLNNNRIVTKDDLTKEQLDLFEDLRVWRRKKYIDEGYYNAYIVFTDKELLNIVSSNIYRKEDLLNVKGIGYKKYDKYGDELFGLISNKLDINLY